MLNWQSHYKSFFGARKYHFDGRKSDADGRKYHVVVHLNRFVALPDETYVHLFRVDGRDDYSAAQGKRVVVCRQRCDAQQLIAVAQRHHHDG
ncbi:hypothetical protein [Sphingobacterium arenae]|uniref:Uncharacterized protein n=1 Tax=Sphingobacterium arenae TaxID=1280598 RepID=A0ABR7Y2V1_9SPHI|nr:hypothetical protein [Sphingobacterium arenae]MBD1425645.1 hypothetical protein [Sphingobacterium arenae]